MNARNSLFAFLVWIELTFRVSAAAGGTQVSHSPERPTSGQKVTVTANLGAAERAVLQVQLVSPGSYIRKSDEGFGSNWRDFPMERHGAAFIGSIPGDLQKHRTLVRYRIKTSLGGNDAFAPVQTNAVPNFAYFVYDGLPPWKGSIQSEGASLTFTSKFLETLPTYHLIANERDVRRSQWDHRANRQPFLGTLVFDGRVYDHIQFHNRGQASTYVAGKNKWALKFNPTDGFNPGVPYHRERAYRIPWNGLNLNPCSSPWAPVNRGMSGLDEALGYRAYQLAGVPSPDTFWIQFRVIDSAEESPANQHNGDLWGLYLVIQEKNGAWLKENGLPDGNIYNPESGTKYQAAGQRDPQRDYVSFRGASNREQTAQWWRANLDLFAYYTFHALNRYVANIDLRPDGNHYLYRKPDGHWVVLPHDLDMMLIPKHHQPGYVMQSRCLDLPELRLEYRNRAREILDLLASDPTPTGGQIGQLIAELSRQLTPSGHERNWAELDAAMWNNHPRTHHAGQFFLTPYSDHRMGGHWERTLRSADFAGFSNYVLEFCTNTRRGKAFRPNDGIQQGYGYGYLAYEARDTKIPEQPTIRAMGDDRFVAAPFESRSDAKFAGLQWRVAEISAPGLPGHTPGKYRYEIEQGWSQETTDETVELTLPANATVPGRTYRIRARYRDQSGRCSHWSQPIQFVSRTK